MLEKKLPVIEMFGPTIQGEGVMCGKQTFFLRLGVCDYRCTMCDSKHAVDPAQIKVWAKYKTAQEIAEELLAMNTEYKTPWVTITGGNPCVHNLSELIDLIHAGGMRVALETQGTFCPSWVSKCDLITVSPKGPGMGEMFNLSLYEPWVYHLAHSPSCLKVVVFDEQDFDFACDIWALTPNIPLYLSLGNKWLPEDNISGDEHVKLLLEHYRNIAEKLYKHPVLNDAIFLPQLHTLIWSNDKGR